MAKTILQQYQVAKSKNIDDTLSLLGYANVTDLEEDLNFLRSVIKDLKGTSTYDTPVTKTLLDLANTLSAAVFNNAQLTGTPTATTPVSGDRTTRIATTEFVHTLIDSIRQDVKYTYTQVTPAGQWNISHNLNKHPSIMVVDSAGTVVYGNIEYITSNSIQLNFSAPFSGVAYLN